MVFVIIKQGFIYKVSGSLHIYLKQHIIGAFCYYHETLTTQQIHSLNYVLTNFLLSL